MAEQTTRADRAVADQQAAGDELERVRAQAAEQVTAARTEAEQHRVDVEAERDRVLAERAAEPGRQPRCRSVGAPRTSSDRTPPFLDPGRFAVDEELVSVERPQAPAQDVRR